MEQGWIVGFAQSLLDTVVDVLPIASILLFFQLVVLRERVPRLRQVLIGFVYVIVGLALFLVGLEKALFPLGRVIAQQLFVGSDCLPVALRCVLCVRGRFATGCR